MSEHLHNKPTGQTGQSDKKNKTANKKGLSRRDVLRSLATLPVLGAFAYGVFRKQRYKNFLRQNILQETSMSHNTPSPVYFGKATGEKLRLGIIGYGGRGEHLVRALGFPHPDVIDSWKQAAMNDSKDKRYEQYMNQPDLNVTINGICDIFDVHAERALKAGANKGRQGNKGSLGQPPKRYRRYTDLLAADDIDAVVVAAPDHWHAPMI